MLVTAYLGTSRVAEAKAALREAAGRGVGDLVWHVLAFQVAFVEGDEAAMAGHARWASGNPSTALAMTQQRALAAAATGRLRDARLLWAEAASAAAHGSPASRQAVVRLKEAEAEALLGDATRAARRLTRRWRWTPSRERWWRRRSSSRSPGILAALTT